MYRGDHMLLVFGDDTAADFFVVDHFILRYFIIFFQQNILHGQRKIKRPVVDKSVSVSFENTSHN